MQNIDNLTDNPLKSKQTSNPRTKPKLNPKLLLILIPIVLGVLSLLVSTISRTNTNTISTNQPSPTTLPQQNSEAILPENKWQQELYSINKQINQDQEILPPKIDQKITF